jgi:uncharacterized protein YndB with AHSA1/START domain
VRYETTAESSAAPELVWRALIDVESWPDWMSNYTRVRRLDHGPLVAGSSAEVEQPGLRRAVYRVTALTPPVEFTWTSTSAGVRTTARHVALPRAGGGTVLTLQVEQRGLLAPLIALVLGRKVRAFLRIEAAGLCRAVERASSA